MRKRARQQSDGGGLCSRARFLAFPDYLERQATLANVHPKKRTYIPLQDASSNSKMPDVRCDLEGKMTLKG